MDRQNTLSEEKHMLTIEQINQVHPGYAEYLYRWDYYMRSYMGAEEYRDGAFLRKYIGEDQGPGDQYRQRLLDTALHNHAKVVVDTYRSFIFRNLPTRTLGNLVDNDFAMRFVTDVDLDGTGMNQFMREVNDMVSIYGSCWVGCDRPAYTVETAAQEEALDIRAYGIALDPTAVTDWSYSRQPNGAKTLSYIKIIEDRQADHDTIVCWTQETITRYKVSKKAIHSTNTTITKHEQQKDAIAYEYGEILEAYEYANPIGYIPFHSIMDTRSFHKGVGTSDIGDVCDIMRSIYNKLSELYSNIRLSSHPSIVAEPSAEINGGSGAIIYVDENTQIQPYLLQPTGASIDGIIKSIELDVEAIDSITHLKAVKAKTGSPMSGVALATTKQLLNAKLADRASMLEIAERKLWNDWFNWQQVDQNEDFHIHYEKSFDLRDKHSDLELYSKAISAVPHDGFVHHIHNEIAAMMIDDERDLQLVQEQIAEDHMKNNIITPETE